MTTIAIDASTPAIATQTTGTIATVVSAGFVPPAGSVIAVRYSANTIDPNDPGNPLITDSLGAHLTWVSIDIGKRPDTPAAEGQVAVWVAVVPDGTPSMTITVTNGAASPNRHAALRTLVLTGVDQVTPTGAHGKSSSLSASSIAAAYTATRNGSLGLLVVCDWFDAGAESAGGAGNTLEGSADIASNYTYGFLRRTNPDGANGATTTITATIPGTSTSLRWAWVEMLPAGDGAAPASVTLSLPPGMPPPMGLAAMAYRYAPDGVTTPIMPEVGTTSFGIIASGTAVKVAPQTGATFVPVRTTGTAVKKAPESGATALAVAAGGVDAKRAVQAGTAMLALRATGLESTADVRAQTGSSVLAVRTTGAAFKIAKAAGPVTVAVSTLGAATKRAAQAGTTELAVTAAGAQIHRQVQTGATEIALRPTGAATNRVAKQAGTTELAIAPAAAASSKKVAAAGTTSIAISAAGFEATGSSRSQTGSCTLGARTTGAARKTAILTGAAMVAATGNGSAVKKAPESGGVALALRTTALEIKRAASAGKSYVGLLGTGAGSKRVNAAGRTVVPLLGFGSQAPPFVPPVRLGDRLEDILNALISFTARLGIFGKVQGHEPKAAPRNGLTAALWLQAMAPALGESGLGSTSLRVAWYLRIYQNFLSEPQDLIDPSVMKACAAVMEALTANFDLDIPQVRAIDLLGMTGPPMAAEAGYIQMDDRRIYRCMTLTIPIIVDDAFVQTA